MKTAILYYSKHHGNTKKLLDAIAAKYEVDLIDVTTDGDQDLSDYDRIGLASGIFFSNYTKPIMTYAEKNLPEGKPVFYIYTYGSPKGGEFLSGIRAIAEAKNCADLGAYHCRGFDTFGPLKLVGGIAKEHPTQEEIDGAVAFYESIKS